MCKYTTNIRKTIHIVNTIYRLIILVVSKWWIFSYILKLDKRKKNYGQLHISTCVYYYYSH
jgi:hypothetical protein